MFYRAVAFIIRLILYVNGGFDIKGRENIPLKGGVIIAPNHLSYLDPPLVGAALPRRATFMARKELFDFPLLGWIAKHYALPVDRDRLLPSTLKETISRLRKGGVVVIFPEGMRSETGELLEAGQGIGMITSHAKTPIVPVFITGSDRALPFNARWLKRAKISIIFGKLIYYSDEEGKESRHSLYRDISNQVMSEIGDLKQRYAKPQIKAE